MLDTTKVTLPNGNVATATYRNDLTDHAFVRVSDGGKQVTISGMVTYNLPGQLPGFRPRGKNAYLVAGEL
jgi:hypothetical protein